MRQLILAVALLAPAAWAVEDIDAQTLLSQPQAERLILDVRTPEEFADGHVPNAVNISHTELEGRLAEVLAYQDKPVVVYCRSGRRAGIAADILEKAGFSQVQHLVGDWKGWQAEQLPVSKED
ncbi:rhodanese-like domain-containing protein [Gallaecimonas sp. GXIMD4217]|uniref:rhodanese-like domain-containing protein n=1 Tax=Gallaecimonas sp. GXIMD4217 TaxID=3131927 RepID=UPI00311B421B